MGMWRETNWGGHCRGDFPLLVVSNLAWKISKRNIPGNTKKVRKGKAVLWDLRP